jgi:hypothetical protein
MFIHEDTIEHLQILNVKIVYKYKYPCQKKRGEEVELRKVH